MTPPASLQHWTRLRIKLCRLQTLRRVEEGIYRVGGVLILLWLFTRFVL